MKRNRSYKLELETIKNLEKLKKEHEISYDKLFKMLIKIFEKQK